MNRHPNQFKSQARDALADEQLQVALARAKSGFIEKRRKAIQLVDDFELLKHRAREAKQKALDNLDHYLQLFEANVKKHGGQVYRAGTPEELNEYVSGVCKQHNARLVTKGKSMISEETGLNDYLIRQGIRVAETDLGEYIIQLAQEKPSHIIAPAVHKTRQQVADLFRDHHALGERDLEEIRSLVDEARQMLRKDFMTADVGITGANLLVADTGSIGLVTNEGNGDLTATLPRVHIVTASIEKVVADMQDAAAILNVLGRSATGQPMSTYTSFYQGPGRADDRDGPAEFHVVILDNGRTGIMNSKYRDMMRCIKCGACLNHCPVYGATGGHAYGWVYPGPMGSVLTPLMQGLDQAKPLPNASSFCGRCAEVCPMGIPLPELLRQLRNDQGSARINSFPERRLLALHGWLLTRPRLYQAGMQVGLTLLNLIQRSRWITTRLRQRYHRRIPPPASRQTFMKQWKQHRHGER
ncbi:MAG: LutB/LldF family L-lactate oxidation iron-sulfur protein [Ketobacteraceae bacterium]|nr:LutB/LldF family L-lactate oxidation iron-sulfur protein [Ketobacteraceae bacterium]